MQAKTVIIWWKDEKYVFAPRERNNSQTINCGYAEVQKSGNWSIWAVVLWTFVSYQELKKVTRIGRTSILQALSGRQRHDQRSNDALFLQRQFLHYFVQLRKSYKKAKIWRENLLENIEAFPWKRERIRSRNYLWALFINLKLRWKVRQEFFSRSLQRSQVLLFMHWQWLAEKQIKIWNYLLWFWNHERESCCDQGFRISKSLSRNIFGTINGPALCFRSY